MGTFKEIRQLYLEQLKQLYDESEIIALLKIIVPERNITLLNQEFNNLTEHKLLLILDELKTGKPLQHVLGTAHFYNLDFIVNQYTLIPRPETEELVYMIIQNHQRKPISLLDIGTGSGCIPVTLKKNLPLADVSSLDISDEALSVAQKNTSLNGVAITFYQDDALKLDSSKYPIYDVIVSNPPYIKYNEQAEMHQNVLDFEPHLALFVDNDEPLIFYDKIADFALTNLKKSGFLYFEINQYLAIETQDLLISKGFKVELIKDINSNYRFVKAGF